LLKYALGWWKHKEHKVTIMQLIDHDKKMSINAKIEIRRKLDSLNKARSFIATKSTIMHSKRENNHIPL
jgi:viroplasmin and RNaseH domain-containing protein